LRAEPKRSQRQQQKSPTVRGWALFDAKTGVFGQKTPQNRLKTDQFEGDRAHESLLQDIHSVDLIRIITVITGAAKWWGGVGVLVLRAHNEDLLRRVLL
jgi:hypothetical protein